MSVDRPRDEPAPLDVNENEPTLAEEVSTTLDPRERRAKRWAETKMDLKWATVLLFTFILGLSGWFWTGWQRPTAGVEDLPAMTHLIFSQDGLVAPFEILSVLLLAALVAGVVIASRDPFKAGDDEPWRAREAEANETKEGDA